jgi:hypothetical protein
MTARGEHVPRRPLADDAVAARGTALEVLIDRRAVCGGRLTVDVGRPQRLEITAPGHRASPADH